MDTPRNFDLRQIRHSLIAIHDAVSFGLRLQGNCGIDFRWEMRGFDLDPDLSYSLTFEARLRDPRVDRLSLTGAADGTTLIDADVQRANEALQPFGIGIVNSMVDEVADADSPGAVPCLRVRLEFAVDDVPPQEYVSDPEDKTPAF